MITEAKLITYHEFKNHKRETRARIRGAIRHWNRLRCGVPDSDGLANYRDLRLAEDASPATVRGEMNKLCALAKYLGHNPVVKKPPRVYRVPQAWSRKQVRRLFREAHQTERVIYGLPGSVFYPAILGVCYDTGERIKAVTSVTWQSIDLDSRTVLYRAEIRKGGYRDALGSLSRGTVRDLRRLHELLSHSTEHDPPTPESPVFQLGCISTLYKAYHQLLYDAGLPTDRRSKFHRLRRTHGTYIAVAGGDATAALGHTTDAVTRESYLDPTMYKKVKLFDPRGGGLMGWLLGN